MTTQKEIMKLRPTGKRLLVQPIPTEKKSGLIITTDSRENPFIAKVIVLGDKTEIPTKEGELLLMLPYAGLKIDSDDKDMPYLLVNDNEVLGMVTA